MALAGGLAASNRPSDIFTEVIFLVETTSLCSVSLLFLVDFVLGAAVVADEEDGDENEEDEGK